MRTVVSAGPLCDVHLERFAVKDAFRPTERLLDALPLGGSSLT